MFDIVRFTLAADVADDGTETVGYPTGRSKGNYSGSNGKHVLVAGGNTYNAPAGFTLTFNANASDITLTNKTGRTLAAGTGCTLQLERRGPRNFDSPPVPAAPELMTEGGFWFVDLGSPNVLDANGICEAQSDTGAHSLTLDGDLVSGGVAVLDVPRNIVVDSGGADTAVLTITGTDVFGNTLVESITLNGTTAVAGKKAFKTVTSVTASATIANAAFVGTGDVLGLPVFLPSAGYVVAELEDGAAASAGTLVAGVLTEPSATTGDVRGTYAPNSAADGDAGFALIVFLPDPSDRGLAQYAG
jgi:hypothetical protein